MKRVGLTLMTLVLCLGFAGCKSPPKMESDDSIFDYMQEEVAKIGEKGGMAAVGIGESRDMSTALSKAKVDARTGLAQLVQVKVENLQKAFIEEIGDPAAGSEMNELFSSATKQITAQTLQGTMPTMQKYETEDGVTTAYVLMVLNPEIIHESLKNNNAKHLYERFRASKAFEELDREIKEFEEAERQGMIGM